MQLMPPMIAATVVVDRHREAEIARLARIATPMNAHGARRRRLRATPIRLAIRLMR